MLARVDVQSGARGIASTCTGGRVEGAEIDNALRLSYHQVSCLPKWLPS
jgi:hypothetical protein